MQKPALNPLTDPHSLAANRRGQLTDSQRQWLRAAHSRLNFMVYGFSLAVLLAMALAVLPAMETAPLEVWLVALGMGAVFGVFVIVPAATAVLDFLRLHRDLRLGRVEQAAGRVKWSRWEYRAEFEGNRLKIPASLNLEPGEYTLYYLPGTRWLVGAERLAVQPADAPGLQPILAGILRCDPEGLDANRRGELAEGQRRYLTFVALANFFAALVALGLAAILGASMLDNAGNPNLGGGLILVAIPVVLVGFFVMRGFRMLQDLSGSTILTAAGAGARSQTGGSRSRTYYWQVGAERFSVSAAAYAAFVEGLNYRLYYTPHGRRILNVEVTN